MKVLPGSFLSRAYLVHAHERMELTIAQAAALNFGEVCSRLESSPGGLTGQQARARLQQSGPNVLGERRLRGLSVLWRQLRNPLLLLLVATAATSIALGEHADAYIILAIIGLSVGLGFVNEYRSERAMFDLHERVRHHAIAVRDGRRIRVDVAELVPGDYIELTTGDVVPADVRLCEVHGLECDQGVLTGESLPVPKDPSPVREPLPFAELSNCAFMGTIVKSGSARGVVLATGARTAFGAIAARLMTQPPETAFQAGLRAFSRMLVNVTLVLTAGVFAVNAALRHPLLDSLLFSLAIAVGLTPQLLPAIVTVSLATGARRLAKRSVIVKRLVSIEDLGNVDVLFTDKTGTLTEGQLALRASIDPAGAWNENVLELGMLCNDAEVQNASIIGGTPLDQAILEYARAHGRHPNGAARIAGIPFDSDRKLMSTLYAQEHGALLIVKGAPEAVLERCGNVPPIARSTLEGLFRAGERVVAVATRERPEDGGIQPEDERDLQLRGFLSFADPPKAGAAQSLSRLRALGIDVRIITGDNEKVAQKVCADLELPVRDTLLGSDLERMSDADLADALPRTSIFARVTPDQKSRIVRLQRESGSDVGFLGDGVNDAVALHEADVGISVDTGTDVAKDAAEIILLQKDLDILADGVVDGRRIFANTIKYVLMGTSSNFGNMFSAAASSLFLPFLPATAPQLLLNNLLYDASEMAIPTDEVDEELLKRPAHWDMSYIRRFMLVFGPISSIFDFMTFGVMLWVFNASVPLFRAGWFVESLVTQTLVVFLIRTRRVPFFASRPGTALLVTTIACAAAGVVIPFTALAPLLGFAAPPLQLLGLLAAMVVAYLLLVDTAKAFFYRRLERAPAPVKRDVRRIRRIAARWTSPGRFLGTFPGP